jgi:hypothetical protein
VPEQQNQWENDTLNGSRGHHYGLCVAVPPQDVGDVEDGWPAGIAGVFHGKERL